MEITKDQKRRSVRKKDDVFEGPASTRFQLEQGQGHIQTKGLGRRDVAHGWSSIQEGSGGGFGGDREWWEKRSEKGLYRALEQEWPGDLNLTEGEGANPDKS